LQNQNIPENNNYIGNNVAIFSEDNFKELTKCLPVIARNHLDNGKSTNLWYEEIVPRESRFYCIVGESDQYSEIFENIIGNGTIQIGGNASIGYGFTKIQFMGGK
jgi:CRISPR-associated protein Cmr4